MADDIVDTSKIDPEDIIDAEYDDIPEERRKQFEAQLKKEQEEATRRLLACYERTRQGVVQKQEFIMPTFPALPPPPHHSPASPPDLGSWRQRGKDDGDNGHPPVVCSINVPLATRDVDLESASFFTMDGSSGTTGH